MSIMFPDLIKITPIKQDTTHGNFDTIDGNGSVINKAYVEDRDIVRRDAQGTPMQPLRIIFVPKNTPINIGDYVEAHRLRGIRAALLTDEEKIRRQVITINRAGGMHTSHLELETRSSGGR